MTCNEDDLGAEIREQTAGLWAPPLYWVPIRHHSPACARALEHLLAEVRPRTILIEGPADCQDLVKACQDKDTHPPVALLSQKGTPDDLSSAYFPLCDYSPEWIALTYGRRRGVTARLIDQSYHDRPEEVAQSGETDEKVQTLMAERRLMHSRYLKGIAEQLGCRDSDEAWDRLFEQRPPEALADWRTFFQDVGAYCALARRDYEPEVIKAGGDGAREAFMVAEIRRAQAETKGPFVVVTGGFHTAALAAALSDGEGESGGQTAATLESEGRNWLIRYSFDQLDALNGYGAGMPAPAYYQTHWETLQAGTTDALRRSTAAILTRIAQDNRRQRLSRIISPAEVQAAVLNAENLARLRGLAGPGRSEVVDAVTSCFLKDAVHRSVDLLADARRVLCGDRLGQIPASAVQPPLVRDAWHRGRSLGLDFDATQVKTLSLELHRRQRHREISRFMHLTTWIDCDLAHWQAGPDYVNGHQLGLMREQWRYAWTPQVEARLLSRVENGTTLEQVALRKLKAEQDALQADGAGGRSGRSAVLLLRACVMGLHRHAAPLAGALTSLIDLDSHLPSLVDCAHRIDTLNKGRALLEAERLEIDLTALIRQACGGALYRLPHLAGLDADAAEEVVPALVALKELVVDQSELLPLFWNHLEALLKDIGATGLIRGACLGLLFQGGQLTVAEMNAALAVMLKPHQPAEVTVGGLRGLIQVARETLWRVPAVLAQLNALIGQWPEDHFLGLLPQLRRLFTDLSPRETDTVARRVADLNHMGTGQGLIGGNLSMSGEDAAALAAADAFVTAGIAHLGLQPWFEEEV